LQFSQALAFIQGNIDPDRDERGCMIHRDIKPKNILVVDHLAAAPFSGSHQRTLRKGPTPGLQMFGRWVPAYTFWRPARRLSRTAMPMLRGDTATTTTSFQLPLRPTTTKTATTMLMILDEPSQSTSAKISCTSEA
jgi:serine/threonine protein kinase